MQYKTGDILLTNIDGLLHIISYRPWKVEWLNKDYSHQESSILSEEFCLMTGWKVVDNISKSTNFETLYEKLNG